MRLKKKETILILYDFVKNIRNVAIKIDLQLFVSGGLKRLTHASSRRGTRATKASRYVSKSMSAADPKRSFFLKLEYFYGFNEETLGGGDGNCA